MSCIPNIDDYINILTDKEVKDFEAINFSEYLKSTREERNLRKVTKALSNNSWWNRKISWNPAIKFFW